jgi:hypothetical protein
VFPAMKFWVRFQSTLKGLEARTRSCPPDRHTMQK